MPVASLYEVPSFGTSLLFTAMSKRGRVHSKKSQILLHRRENSQISLNSSKCGRGRGPDPTMLHSGNAGAQGRTEHGFFRILLIHSDFAGVYSHAGNLISLSHTLDNVHWTHKVNPNLLIGTYSSPLIIVVNLRYTGVQGRTQPI